MLLLLLFLGSLAHIHDRGGAAATHYLHGHGQRRAVLEEIGPADPGIHRAALGEDGPADPADGASSRSCGSSSRGSPAGRPEFAHCAAGTGHMLRAAGHVAVRRQDSSRGCATFPACGTGRRGGPKRV